MNVLIASAPTIDAVPVVRCKDCKWLYSEMGNYCCRSHRGLVRICENSFCSYGERKRKKKTEKENGKRKRKKKGVK